MSNLNSTEWCLNGFVRKPSIQNIFSCGLHLLLVWAVAAAASTVPFRCMWYRAPHLLAYVLTLIWRLAPCHPSAFIFYSHQSGKQSSKAYIWYTWLGHNSTFRSFRHSAPRDTDDKRGQSDLVWASCKLCFYSQLIGLTDENFAIRSIGCSYW
jgi:hypothetical protein